jgi:hypothetical protein
VITLAGVSSDFFSVESVEIITEFRRLELIAEEHARLNDNFARAGVRDAEAAIGPWQGLVWISARLDLTNRTYAGEAPDVGMVIGAANDQRPVDPTSARVISRHGSEGELIGWTADAAFAASPLKNRRVPILIRFNGRELTRLRIDFAQLD